MEEREQKISLGEWLSTITIFTPRICIKNRVYTFYGFLSCSIVQNYYTDCFKIHKNISYLKSTINCFGDFIHHSVAFYFSISSSSKRFLISLRRSSNRNIRLYIFNHFSFLRNEFTRERSILDSFFEKPIVKAHVVVTNTDKTQVRPNLKNEGSNCIDT